MSRYEEKLSAFLDGELSETEAREIEDAIARDPALQVELDALMAADVLAGEEFAAMQEEPVPLDLAAAIRSAPDISPANTVAEPVGWSVLKTAAAALVLLFAGWVGGYMSGSSRPEQVAMAPGWLQDISEYHAVYADQKRHLVEVPASETDHIIAWLTATVGANVRIPDLANNGLTFQGARLLVAAGKPVAQLMYTDGDGAVVALCLIQSDTPSEGITSRSLNGFEMVSWGGDGANLVIIGDEDRDDLTLIAESAAAQV